jgi:RNA polymerase primary sigma factor
LADNSKTFRLPTYLHERLIAIRSAKYALEDQGIAPTVEVRRLYRWNLG